MIERADVSSEGAVEDGVYYGTTSLRCPVEEEMVGAIPAAEQPEQLARVIVSDAQARLRILRLAHREAVVRATAPLDVLQAEIDARVLRVGDRWTLSIDVDVSATGSASCEGASCEAEGEASASCSADGAPSGDASWLGLAGLALGLAWHRRRR